MAYWQKGTIVDGNPGGRVNVDANGPHEIRFLSPKFVLNDGSDYGIVGYGMTFGPEGIVQPGFVSLVDADGAYLFDSDGTYLVEPV